MTKCRENRSYIIATYMTVTMCANHGISLGNAMVFLKDGDNSPTTAPQKGLVFSVWWMSVFFFEHSSAIDDSTFGGPFSAFLC